MGSNLSCLRAPTRQRSSRSGCYGHDVYIKDKNAPQKRQRKRDAVVHNGRNVGAVKPLLVNVTLNANPGNESLTLLETVGNSSKAECSNEVVAAEVEHNATASYNPLNAQQNTRSLHKSVSSNEPQDTNNYSKKDSGISSNFEISGSDNSNDKKDDVGSLNESCSSTENVSIIHEVSASDKIEKETKRLTEEELSLIEQEFKMKNGYAEVKVVNGAEGLNVNKHPSCAAIDGSTSNQEPALTQEEVNQLIEEEMSFQLAREMTEKSKEAERVENGPKNAAASVNSTTSPPKDANTQSPVTEATSLVGSGGLLTDTVATSLSETRAESGGSAYDGCGILSRGQPLLTKEYTAPEVNCDKVVLYERPSKYLPDYYGAFRNKNVYASRKDADYASRSGNTSSATPEVEKGFTTKDDTENPAKNKSVQSKKMSLKIADASDMILAYTQNTHIHQNIVGIATDDYIPRFPDGRKESIMEKMARLNTVEKMFVASSFLDQIFSLDVYANHFQKRSVMRLGPNHYKKTRVKVLCAARAIGCEEEHSCRACRTKFRLRKILRRNISFMKAKLAQERKHHLPDIGENQHAPGYSSGEEDSDEPCATITPSPAKRKDGAQALIDYVLSPSDDVAETPVYKELEKPALHRRFKENFDGPANKLPCIGSTFALLKKEGSLCCNQDTDDAPEPDPFVGVEGFDPLLTPNRFVPNTSAPPAKKRITMHQKMILYEAQQKEIDQILLGDAAANNTVELCYGESYNKNDYDYAMALDDLFLERPTSTVVTNAVHQNQSSSVGSTRNRVRGNRGPSNSVRNVLNNSRSGRAKSTIPRLPRITRGRNGNIVYLPPESPAAIRRQNLEAAAKKAELEKQRVGEEEREKRWRMERLEQREQEIREARLREACRPPTNDRVRFPPLVTRATPSEHDLAGMDIDALLDSVSGMLFGSSEKFL